MLPALLVYCCVVVLPALYTAFLSLFKWNGLGEKKFVLFRNYVNLFTTDAVFKTALKNNIIWIILTLLFTMTIALLLAMLLNRKFKGRVVYRAIFYFPYMLSWIVIGIIWKWIYNPNIGAAALWQGVGQPMLYFLAGLQGIPQELYEAAAVDGAGKVATFFNVTIPQLKETFVIVLATLVIASLKVYDVVYVMTNGGPVNSTQTLASYMYAQTFSYSNLGTGSAIVVVMMVMMMVIIIPYVLYTTKDE